MNSCRNRSTTNLRTYPRWKVSSIGSSRVRRRFAAIWEFGRNEIRIMTVHGAKGLEAPIVFLPDTCRVARHDSRILWMTNETVGELPLWPSRREFEVGPADKARLAARRRRDQEYRRLLYVAMTPRRRPTLRGRLDDGATGDGLLVQPDLRRLGPMPPRR